MQPLRPGRASVHLKRHDAKLGLGFPGASSESDGDAIRSGAMTPVSPSAAAAPKTIKFDASELVNDSNEGLEVFPMDSLKHDSHID